MLENNSKGFQLFHTIKHQEKNHNDSRCKIVELINVKLLSADSLINVWLKKLNNNQYHNQHTININDLIFDF